MDIVEIRKSLGLSQAVMAQKLGISPGYLGDLERKHRRVTIKLARKYERLGDRRGLVDAVVNAELGQDA